MSVDDLETIVAEPWDDWGLIDNIVEERKGPEPDAT